MLEKKNFLSAKKDPKQFFGSVPSSGTTPEMNGVYSDVRHILHLSLVDICLVIVVSFCWQTNQTGLQIKTSMEGGNENNPWIDSYN